MIFIKIHANFKCHTVNLETRARKRHYQNFSHKSWHLSHETLKGIYGALIKYNLKRPQKVQNRALRSIYRLEWTSPTLLVHSISNILPIRERLIQLGVNSLTKAVVNNEYMCILLQEYIDSQVYDGSSIRRKEKDTPLCLFYQDITDE